MSELDFNDFFKQVKKDRDDRLAKTLIKQSELKEDLFWVASVDILSRFTYN